jgi:hypothetical protein
MPEPIFPITFQRLSVVIVLILSGYSSKAQNLVPNGSFEEGITCPSFVGNVTEECAFWYGSLIDEAEADPTPDWFHTCSEFELLSPPQIAFGIQIPFDGGGYLGVVAFSRNFSNYRELIGIALTEPLVIGESYLVEFQISATSTPGNAVWCNNIGFNFSTHPSYTTNSFPPNSSHFAIDTIIPESSEWTQVSEIFIPDSSYNYFHIGNFYTDSNTDTLQSGLSAYFLIDQVNITQSLFSSIEDELKFSLFPNPATDILTVRSFSNTENMNFEIIDIIGKVIASGTIEKSNTISTINVSHLNSGIYFLNLVTSKTKTNEVFIKN